MRILITTSTFPVELNEGSPRFVFDLAKALKERGEDVEVLAPHAPGAAKRESWDGVQIRRFRYFWPTNLQRLAYGGGMRENLRASWLARIQVPLLVIAQTLTLHRGAKRGRYDVVNSHWMVPQGLSAAIARGRHARFRHVLHIHAADVYFLAKLWFGPRLAAYVLARSDAVLADGSDVRNALNELVGFDSGAVLQPMGAWVDQFQASVEPAPTDFPDGYLVFVGRLVEKKGLVYLLRALVAVRRNHPNVGLVVIGSGPLQGELEGEAALLGLGDAVRFVGSQPHDQVIRYLRGAQLAVVPSIIDSRGETEGMPTVVVEMMAAGLRVVGSDVAGIPDVIEPGSNGWLARPGDPVDLAEQVSAGLSADANLVRESARATAARFDWPVVAGIYLSHLGSGSADHLVGKT